MNASHDGVATPYIRIAGVSRQYGQVRALHDLSIDIAKHEFIAILGPSGSGKSTLLRLIAGLDRPSTGRIFFEGADVTDLPPYKRGIGMVFQEFLLFPHRTVRENLAFPLRRVLRMKDEKEIDERSRQVLEAVGLIDTINKMPGELSGGMRKRLALARTLIVHPEIILYDEPTTGLDTITSREISELILEMKEKYNTTSLIVTHDIPCAKIVADRIVVMRDGKSVADGKTKDLENSTDDFIRSFFN